METYILAITFLLSVWLIFIKCLLAGIWVGLTFFLHRLINKIINLISHGGAANGIIRDSSFFSLIYFVLFIISLIEYLCPKVSLILNYIRSCNTNVVILLCFHYFFLYLLVVAVNNYYEIINIFKIYILNLIDEIIKSFKIKMFRKYYY
jgi:hypothetical protein